MSDTNTQPSLGTKRALLRYIASLEGGQPNYGAMAPALAAAVRQQLPTIENLLSRMGAFGSLRFVGSAAGMDIYDATFATGQIEWFIAPLSADGKVVRRAFYVLP